MAIHVGHVNAKTRKEERKLALYLVSSFFLPFLWANLTKIPLLLKVFPIQGTVQASRQKGKSVSSVIRHLRDTSVKHSHENQMTKSL